MSKGGAKGAGKGKTNPLKSIDPSCKVWVGGLSESVKWKALEDHFNSAGKTRWTEIMPKGVACVAYKSPDEAATAIAMLNGTHLGGQTITVDTWEAKTTGTKTAAQPMAGVTKWISNSWNSFKGSGKSWKSVYQPQFVKVPSTARFTGAKGKGAGKGGKGNPLKKIAASCKVWVGDIPAQVTWKQLEEHFNQVGKTRWVELMPKGVACVAYSTAEEAATAIETLTGSDVGGHVLTLDTWTKKASNASNAST